MQAFCSTPTTLFPKCSRIHLRYKFSQLIVNSHKFVKDIWIPFPARFLTNPIDVKAKLSSSFSMKTNLIFCLILCHFLLTLYKAFHYERFTQYQLKFNRIKTGAVKGFTYFIKTTFSWLILAFSSFDCKTPKKDFKKLS